MFCSLITMLIKSTWRGHVHGWHVSSTHERGPSTLSASCVRTACLYHFYSRSFSQSSSQSSPILLWRGGAFRRLLTVSASIHSFVELLNLVCGRLESATTTEELVGAADEILFWKLRQCRHHVLDELLLPKSDTQHIPRKRRHDLTLPEKKKTLL